MFDKIKYHLLASYLWGVAFTFTSGDKFLDASIAELIIQPPIFALIVVVLPLIIYFLSVLITKDKEKALKFFKTSFNIIFILAIILMIMGAIGASKYEKWKEEGKQAVSLSIKQ
jgi:heme O synthase-like polyprenyltransferase|tara:strand:+ start:1562 stop:1903 length:342 start_codon:yes stop_codon:yes gene_type:complete